MATLAKFTMELPGPHGEFTVQVTVPDNDVDIIKVETDDDLCDISGKLTEEQKDLVSLRAVLAYEEAQAKK